jgi:hypothetical protein
MESRHLSALVLYALFVLAAVPTASAQEGNGRLYYLSTSGIWEPVGIDMPMNAIDVESYQSGFLARTSEGSYLQISGPGGSWADSLLAFPAGTVEVRALGELVDENSPLLARTGTQALHLLTAGSWQPLGIDAPPGTVRIVIGSGLGAVTGSRHLLVLSGTSWAVVRTLDSTILTLVSYQDSICALLSDGTWLQFDTDTSGFIASGIPSLPGARIAFISQNLLMAWK